MVVQELNCLGCNAELVGESFKGEEPTYQFDNALWVAFYGGYGMFVDNLESWLPTNTEEQWLFDDRGNPKINLEIGRFRMPVPFKLWDLMKFIPRSYHWKVKHLRMMDNPNYEPELRVKRTFQGAAYEAVICHECAHKLCDTVPWVNYLLDPVRSHSHKTSYHEAHPDHYGWDYDRRGGEEDG